jgi:REP element-mobilizing transposase RayT
MLFDHHAMNFDRTFFVTTVTALRRPIFRRDANSRLMIETLVHYRNLQKFLLHEFIIMPDHVHLFITSIRRNFVRESHAIHKRRILLPTKVWRRCMAAKFHESSRARFRRLRNAPQLHSAQSSASQISEMRRRIPLFICGLCYQCRRYSAGAEAQAEDVCLTRR